MNRPTPEHDPLYELGLKLLELLEKPVHLNLKHPEHPYTLSTHGTLLRAFDPPAPTSAPSITLMIGAQSITLRLSEILIARYIKQPQNKKTLQSIHLLLADGFALRIEAKPQKTKPPQPE